MLKGRQDPDIAMQLLYVFTVSVISLAPDISESNPSGQSARVSHLINLARPNPRSSLSSI
jgi:hypothetical protein